MTQHMTHHEYSTTTAPLHITRHKTPRHNTTATMQQQKQKAQKSKAKSKDAKKTNGTVNAKKQTSMQQPHRREIYYNSVHFMVFWYIVPSNLNWITTRTVVLAVQVPCSL